MKRVSTPKFLIYLLGKSFRGTAADPGLVPRCPVSGSRAVEENLPTTRLSLPANKIKRVLKGK